MIRCSVVALIASILVLAHVPSIVAHGGQADVGQLRIEGQGIEQLILRGTGAEKHTFERPGEMLTLPTGTYYVHEVRLQGGHYSRSSLDLRVRVNKDTPATLKMGAPLRQVVRVERQGPVMVLHYELTGQGGEPYGINRSQAPQKPAFTIYRGDRKVLSGEFEFG